jgi:hypothetical protein
MFVYIYACSAILGVKTSDFLFLNFNFKIIIKRQGVNVSRSILLQVVGDCWKFVTFLFF